MRILIAVLLVILSCAPLCSAARKKYSPKRMHARSHASYKAGKHAKVAKHYKVKTGRHASPKRAKKAYPRSVRPVASHR